MRTVKLLAFIAIIIIIPASGKAWGLQGHRIVAAVAENHLSPKAKKAIQQILGYESMAITSNWPDFIKSDTSYRYLSSWHYVNFDDNLSFEDMKTALATDTMPNVYNKTSWLIAQLKNKHLAKSKQLFYLRLLIHFIGDIHQPMHLGRESDLGGNKIKLFWFGESTNLHSVWDSKLVDEQQLSYTEYTRYVDHATASEIKTWQQQPLTQWLFESYTISRKIYTQTKADSKLSYNYNFDWIETVNQQLLKGGIRLAGVLNQIFG